MSGPESRHRRNQHLRATADSIAEQAERVAKLEEEKEHLPDGDPGLLERSKEVDRLIDRMQQESRAELELALRPDDEEDRSPIH